MKRKFGVCLLVIMALLCTGCGGEQKSSSAQAIQEVTLYFSNNDAYLETETRLLASPVDKFSGNKIVEALVLGPDSEGLYPTLPEGTKCLNYRYDGQKKLAIVDFSEEILQATGSAGELLAVYSVVNSLTELSEINQVQILVEGEVVETISGHLDTAESLNRDLSLVYDNTK